MNLSISSYNRGLASSNVTDVKTSDLNRHEYVAAAVAGIGGCVGIVLNTAILTAVRRYNNVRRLPASYFIKHLAIVDLCASVLSLLALVGLVYLAMTDEASKSDQKNLRWLCTGFIMADTTVKGQSSWILICIGVERCLALKQPLKYKRIMASILPSVFICLGWLGSAASSTVFLFLQIDYTGCNYDFNYRPALKIYHIVLTCLCVIILTVLYGYIFIKAKQVRAKLLNSDNKGTTGVVLASDVKLANTNLKFLKMFMLVIGVYMLNYAVVFVLNIISMTSFLERSTIIAARKWGMVTQVLSLVDNPVSYALSNKEFNKAFRLMFSCQRRTENQNMTKKKPIADRNLPFQDKSDSDILRQNRGIRDSIMIT